MLLWSQMDLTELLMPRGPFRQDGVFTIQRQRAELLILASKLPPQGGFLILYPPLRDSFCTFVTVLRLLRVIGTLTISGSLCLSSQEEASRCRSPETLQIVDGLFWVTRTRTPKSPDDRLGQGPIRHKRLLDGGNGVCGSVLGSLGARAAGGYLLGSAIDAEREQSFVEGADAIKVRSIRAEWEMVGLAGDGHLSSWSALSPSLCILHSEHFALEGCLR